MDALERFDRLVVRLSVIFMMFIGAISPFFVNKAYVYILSPACAIGLSAAGIAFMRWLRSR